MTETEIEKSAIGDDAQTDHQIGELDELELEPAIAAPAEPTPAPPPPDQITETELWRLTALSERHEKLTAQIQLLTEQMQRLQSELGNETQESANYQRELAQKYGLGPADRVLLPAGGRILRAVQNGKG